MAIFSKDIQEQSFKIERRGYDVDEVDVFLERVAYEIDGLNEEVSNLRAQLTDAQQFVRQNTNTETNEGELARKDARIAELEAQLRECTSEDSAIAQALIVAQRTGEDIIARAKGEAEKTRQNAEEEARRILDKAGAEKQRVIDHINELNESREQTREEYQEMLKDFISTATKRLSEIGGDIPTFTSIPSESTSYEPEVSKWIPTSSTATYTTPTMSSVVSAPATPKPSMSSKDLTGYGDADDTFTFDEID